jgi:valyl-tRNA synthetase
MIYGHDKTIHRTQHLNVELSEDGDVVSVWFRCSALPFDQTVVSKSRAKEMKQMYKTGISKIKLNAVEIELGD